MSVSSSGMKWSTGKEMKEGSNNAVQGLTTTRQLMMPKWLKKLSVSPLYLCVASK